jgi:hypothetical protein
MTKKFRNYVISVFSITGGFAILNETRAVFEKIFSVDLIQLRWGIWAFGIIALCWFFWRGFYGFKVKMDFFFDDD